MTTLSERNYGGEFLISDGPRTYTREKITVAVSQTLKSGSVLGKIALGAATLTPTAVGTNTGTGSIGTVTADAGAPAGDWKVIIIEPASNAGNFVVMKPDGSEDGHGTVAVAYDGGINFTLADATDFVAGDSINVNLAYAAGSGQYVSVNPAATDGSQNACAILWDAVTTDGSTTAQASAVVRGPCEVDGTLLDFAALSSPQKTAAKAQLAALGFVIR